MRADYDEKNHGWGTVQKFLDWDVIEFCELVIAPRVRSLPIFDGAKLESFLAASRRRIQTSPPGGL